jgi:hypothetical protein
MFKRNLINVLMLVFAGATIIMLVGCSSQDATTTESIGDEPQAVAPVDYNEPVIVHKLILDGSEAQDSIMAAYLSAFNIDGGRQWIESQGYVYTDSNSFALVDEEYHMASNDVQVTVGTEPVAAKRTPDIEPTSRLIGADSVVWLAFENPTHDMANHTALVCVTHGGETRVLFIELDVSAEDPVLIRGGLIVNGQFVQDENADEQFDSWWGCVLGGTAGSAAGCLLMNCAWGQCTAIGAVVSVVGCTVSALFD